MRPALLNLLLLPTRHTHTHVPRDVYPQNIPNRKTFCLKSCRIFVDRTFLKKDKEEEPHSAAIVLLLRGWLLAAAAPLAFNLQLGRKDLNLNFCVEERKKNTQQRDRENQKGVERIERRGYCRWIKKNGERERWSRDFYNKRL